MAVCLIQPSVTGSLFAGLSLLDSLCLAAVLNAGAAPRRSSYTHVPHLSINGRIAGSKRLPHAHRRISISILLQANNMHRFQRFKDSPLKASKTSKARLKGVQCRWLKGALLTGSSAGSLLRVKCSICLPNSLTACRITITPRAPQRLSRATDGQEHQLPLFRQPKP